MEIDEVLDSEDIEEVVEEIAEELESESEEPEENEVSIGTLRLATSDFVKPNKIPEPKKNLEEFVRENEFEVFDFEEEDSLDPYESIRREEDDEETMTDAEKEARDFYGEGKNSFYDSGDLYSSERKDKNEDGELEIGAGDLRRIGEDFYSSGENGKKKDSRTLFDGGRTYFEDSKRKEYLI